MISVTRIRSCSRNRVSPPALSAADVRRRSPGLVGAEGGALQHMIDLAAALLLERVREFLPQKLRGGGLLWRWGGCWRVHKWPLGLRAPQRLPHFAPTARRLNGLNRTHGLCRSPDYTPESPAERNHPEIPAAGLPGAPESLVILRALWWPERDFRGRPTQGFTEPRGAPAINGGARRKSRPSRSPSRLGGRGPS